MIQSGNGLIPDHGKLRGNYTGERLKSLRPETYREVVRLLAEPREHVSIREICRRCHVTDDTVKAVERREAVPIAARKQELLVQAARIAQRAYNRVEDEIDEAPLSQAVITAGVFTDKIVALSPPETMHVDHAVTIEPAQRMWERLQDIYQQLVDHHKSTTPPLLEAATIDVPVPSAPAPVPALAPQLHSVQQEQPEPKAEPGPAADSGLIERK